jgi:hypothetical protein
MFVRADRVRLGAENQLARHSEMHNKDMPVVEMDQNIFGAAIDRRHATAFQAADKIHRQLLAQIGAALFYLDEAAADQMGSQAAHDSFDFGKFRHCQIQTWTGLT